LGEAAGGGLFAALVGDSDEQEASVSAIVNATTPVTDLHLSTVRSTLRAVVWYRRVAVPDVLVGK